MKLEKDTMLAALLSIYFLTVIIGYVYIQHMRNTIDMNGKTLAIAGVLKQNDDRGDVIYIPFFKEKRKRGVY